MTKAREQMRRGTAAQWVAANPVLGAGEWGWESDTNLVKIGDGGTAWDLLDYYANITDLTADVAAANADLATYTTDVASVGAWQDYVPTWTHWSVASGTYRYSQVDKLVTVHFDGSATAGGSGIPALSCPVTPKTISRSLAVGEALLFNSGSPYALHLVMSYVDKQIYFLQDYVASNTPPGYTYPAITSNPIAGSFTYEAA